MGIAKNKITHAKSKKLSAACSAHAAADAAADAANWDDSDNINDNHNFANLVERHVFPKMLVSHDRNIWQQLDLLTGLQSE